MRTLIEALTIYFLVVTPILLARIGDMLSRIYQEYKDK